MHESVMAWGKRIIDSRRLASKSVLEVGSINVNGSLRQYFTGEYIGVDLRPGPGVDRIANGHDLPFKSRSFGVVVCTETLSHDPYPWKTIKEMYRILRKGGILILTVRGIGFGRNDSPCDYYRFTEDGVNALLTDAGFEVGEVEPDPQYSGVLAWGQK